MARYLLITFLFFFSIDSFTATPLIRFATEANYPPFVALDEKGEMYGFEISLIKALCLTMQAQCTFTHRPWNTLIPSLSRGEFDALFGGMSIIKGREAFVDFTKPFYRHTVSLVAHKDNDNIAHDAISLKGKTIGVQEGSAFVGYLIQHYHGQINVKTYPNIKEAFSELASQHIDGLMADTPTINAWLSHESHGLHYRLVGKPIHDQRINGKGYGIAVKKHNKSLVNALNKAISTVHKNGLLTKLITYYFGEIALHGNVSENNL